MSPAPFLLAVLFATAAAAADAPAPAKDIPNDAIDMPGFLETSQAAAEHRRTHRVEEAEFLKMMAEPGTIVLDARSAEKYARLHVRGAINLSFPDIAIATLQEAIPDKDTRILIYCNNNFAEAEQAFPSKIAVASLNLSTYVSLYSYGYRNVYELGPRVALKASKLPFAGTMVAELTAANAPDASR
jgi:hypothetical protein